MRLTISGCVIMVTRLSPTLTWGNDNDNDSDNDSSDTDQHVACLQTALASRGVQTMDLTIIKIQVKIVKLHMSHNFSKMSVLLLIDDLSPCHFSRTARSQCREDGDSK